MLSYLFCFFLATGAALGPARQAPALHVQDCQSGFGIGERVIQGCSWVALVPVCRAIPLRFGQHITCPSVMYEIVSQASGSANVSQRGR